MIKHWRWLTISKDMLLNEGIRAREVRLIDQNGEQLGIKTKTEALEIAARANLDLVLVAPNAKPPVARIMDYGNLSLNNKRKIKKHVKIKKSSILKKFVSVQRLMNMTLIQNFAMQLNSLKKAIK